MSADEIAILQATISSLPVQAFLFYAWFKEREERVSRTNQLVQKRQDEDNAQLQKELNQSSIEGVKK